MPNFTIKVERCELKYEYHKRFHLLVPERAMKCIQFFLQKFAFDVFSLNQIKIFMKKFEKK